MKLLLALFLQSSAPEVPTPPFASASEGAATAIPQGATQGTGKGQVPVYSPEPITMIALAGGAAASAALAHRRRKGLAPLQD
ncbi:MAG: PEP-CTERM sorting domain-containing protein [Planctomycetota bacterium]|jgi:hypothetical protein